MEFSEALSELAGGRCEGIKLNAAFKIVFTIEGEDLEPQPSINAMLRDDWELVNPKPMYELVEIVKYYSPSYDACYSDKAIVLPNDAIKLTGTQKVEIKPKVKIRKEIGYARHFIGNTTGIPDDAQIFAEWAE